MDVSSDFDARRCERSRGEHANELCLNRRRRDLAGGHAATIYTGALNLRPDLVTSQSLLRMVTSTRDLPLESSFFGNPTFPAA
jgi:hypothetical protein